MQPPSIRRVLLTLACIGFSGCVHVGPSQQQPWRLFTLSPVARAKAENAFTTISPSPARPAIGVGPIRLPRYLEQDQIVTRTSPNRVAFSDNDRWAEPLDENIGQVLAYDLSGLLRDRARLEPWPAPAPPRYQLEIEVLGFEADTVGTAHLSARWLLRDVASRQTLVERETLTASGGGASTDHAVAALSSALGDLSVAIANAVRDVVPSVAPTTSQAGDR